MGERYISFAVSIMFEDQPTAESKSICTSHARFNYGFPRGHSAVCLHGHALLGHNQICSLIRTDIRSRETMAMNNDKIQDNDPNVCPVNVKNAATTMAADLTLTGLKFTARRAKA